MDLKSISILVIAGPTGVGKTQLSIDLAKEFNGEIINGDSLQVYKHLDIGTGKITPSEMDGVPHHMLDILEVSEPYNASEFKHESTKLIKEIHQRGKLPIIVGGTGLYLEGLLYDLEFGRDDSQDEVVRKGLEEQVSEIGDLAMWNRLNELDPEAAKKIPYQNVRRTIRALEVIQVTGRSFSSQTGHDTKRSVFNECLLVLNREREALYDRINLRVHEMVKADLENEAKWLYDQAEGADWQSVKGIGYKEWWPYFNNQMDKEEVIETIQQNSRRYAKRQLTWFRNRMKHPQWIDMTNEEGAINESSSIVKEHIENN